MSEWKTELPPKAGYYEADFGDGHPSIVWLTPVKASDYNDPTMEDGIVWGWDETDDPEAVEVECSPDHKFRWREINA